MIHVVRLACSSLCLLLASWSVAAQPDPSYVPPKGGYDTPGSFLKPLDAVDETLERELGAPLTNAYQRQVRLKVLGLEEVNRLSALKQSVDQGKLAEQKRQEEVPERRNSLLGGLLGQANALMGKEVARQKEEAQDDLAIRLVEAGSPSDTDRAALVDMMSVPNQVTGSIFGAKVNKDVRVSVSSDDFLPRVLIVRYRPKGMMTPLQGDAAPEFSVVASGEQDGPEQKKAFAVFDRSKASADGSVGVYIVVTSADGKATAGKYKIRYYPQP